MTRAAGGILVVFGLDAEGRRRAARFREVDEPTAKRAAEALGYRAIRVIGPQGREVADRLAEGRLYRTGSGFAPGVSRKTYALLAEIAEAGARSGQPPPVQGVTSIGALKEVRVGQRPIDEPSIRKQKGEPK